MSVQPHGGVNTGGRDSKARDRMGMGINNTSSTSNARGVGGMAPTHNKTSQRHDSKRSDDPNEKKAFWSKWKSGTTLRREDGNDGERGKKMVAEVEEFYTCVTKDVRKFIFDGAEKLREKRPGFCEDVDHIRQGEDATRLLVRRVCEELVAENHELVELEFTNMDLSEENKKLMDRVVDWERDERRDYEKKMASKRKAGKDLMTELQERNTKLFNQLSALRAEKQDATAGGGAQAEEEMQRVIAESQAAIQKKEQSHNEAIWALKQSHNYEKVKLKGQIEEQLRSEHNMEMNNATFKLKETINKQKKEIENIHDNYRKEMSTLKEEQELKKQTLKNRLADKQREFRKDLEDLELEYWFRTSEMHRDHQDRLQAVKQSYEADATDMHHAHQSELQAVRESYETNAARMESEMDDLREQLESVGERWNKKHKTKMQELREENESELEEANRRASDAELECQKLETEHAAQLQAQKDALAAERVQQEARAKHEEANLRKSYEELNTALEEKHAKEKQQLRKDRDAYSAALLERDKVRDKVEYLKDIEITDKFRTLVQEVEKLARAEWKNAQNQQTSLSRFSPTPLRLMRDLLQYSIWVVLHEHIFCSPFRVFGDEGRRLEKDWQTECNGPDPAFDNGSYVWPTPEVETERWRFVTVKECRASLRKPVPSVYDARANLKKGFTEMRDTLKKKLTETLGEVVDINESHTDAIKELTQKATNMWLEFSMQHYRIIIEVQGAKMESIDARIHHAKRSSLDLVLVPKLKSFGNSKGLDLQAEETIGGFNGEIIKVGGGTSKPPLSSQRGGISRRPSISQPR